MGKAAEESKEKVGRDELVTERETNRINKDRDR